MSVGDGNPQALESELRRALGGSAPGEENVSRRLASAASEAGIADVRYAVAESPVGELLLAATPTGLVRLALPGLDRDQVLDDLARRISPRVIEDASGLSDLVGQLDDYLGGRRDGLHVKLDWSLVGGGFARRVLVATARVPAGSTSTYAAIAAEAGSARAHRAAGNALGSNPLPLVIPCHRIIGSGGGLGGYGGGLALKRRLLSLEGSLG